MRILGSFGVKGNLKNCDSRPSLQARANNLWLLKIQYASGKLELMDLYQGVISLALDSECAIRDH